jgi:hypothetical protein
MLAAGPFGVWCVVVFFIELLSWCSWNSCFEAHGLVESTGLDLDLMMAS